MHRLADNLWLTDDNEDNAPFQIIYLDLGYMPNSYSAYAAYQSLLGDWRYPFSFGYKLRVSSEIAQGLF